MFRFLKGPLLGTAVVAGVLTLAACGGGGGGGGGTSTPSNAVTFMGTSTGNNTASASGGKFSPAGAFQPLTAVPSYLNYELFCVTFTNPPSSGSGNFNADGTFSVTVSNAGGVPVGCFIEDISIPTQPLTVSTVSFTIGITALDSSGAATGAVFAPGTYMVDIQFDVGTGIATATVTGATGGTAGALTAADLGGSWVMYCDPANFLPDMAACARNIGLELNGIFFDPITATDAVKGAVYGLGVWQSKTEFDDAGDTEGLVNPITGISGITSLLGSSTPGWSATAPDPTQKFSGFTSDGTYIYDYATNKMPAADVWAWMVANVKPTDVTGNTSWVDPACYKVTTPTVPGWSASTWPVTPPTFGAQAINTCLLQAISVAAEKDRQGALDYSGHAGKQFFIPRVAGINWTNFAIPTPTSTNIEFAGTKVASTPELGGRPALLGLEFSGNSATGHTESSDSWTSQYSINGGAPVSNNCTQTENTNVVLVKTGTDTFDGFFSQGETVVCSQAGTSNSNSAFKMKLVRSGTPLGTSITLPSTAVQPAGTPTLDGQWERCISGLGVNPDVKEMRVIAGSTIVYARTAHSTTTGDCGIGELGQLQAAIVADLTLQGSQAIHWSFDGSTFSVAIPNDIATAPMGNSESAQVLATVTGAYGDGTVAGDKHGLLFVMDNSGSPKRLYIEWEQTPAVDCALVGYYTPCVDMLFMQQRN